MHFETFSDLATTTAATSTGTATTASATITTTLNVGNDVWGQGDCPHNTQFDCSQALYGVVDQGSCIGLINRCDGIRDCTWSDLSFPSWDEDPTWCAILANNPGFF